MPPPMTTTRALAGSSLMGEPSIPQPIVWDASGMESFRSAVYAARSQNRGAKVGSKLHDNAAVIDGLIIANFTREVFEDMRKGGLTAANCTCSVWENFRGSMD